MSSGSTRSRVTDVDGNRYWDFHNGFGSMVQGHAHPAIVQAIRERAALGTHFAAVTEEAVIVAEALADRFGLVDYETFKANQDVPLTELAWLWNMNRGIYMTPGREAEWTPSVTHTEEAVDAYVAAFDEMAAALTA